MHVYSVALSDRFRGIDTRQGVVIRGEAGWGEFSPFVEYHDAEAVAWLRAAQEAAHGGWPEPVRSVVPVNATIPAVGPGRARELVTQFAGCTTAKVKVAQPGQSVGDEANRLAAVREALGPSGRIRVDANAAWDVETAAERLAVLDRAAGGLEYAEQPCATVAELAQLRRRTHVPIAADESIRRASDPLAVVRAQAADVVVLKVQPLGGVRACLELAAQIPVPVVVSSALETSVGIAAGVALAAALPQLPFACGLATVGLMRRDIVDQPLVATGGCLPVGVRPAPAVDDQSWRADEPSQRWWRERWERVVRLSEAPESGRRPW